MIIIVRGRTWPDAALAFAFALEQAGGHLMLDPDQEMTASTVFFSALGCAGD